MRECFLCGRTDHLERHHLYGGGLRKKSDKLGLVVDLCHWCHNEPPNGVHHNKAAMRRLKRQGQLWAMQEQGWTEDEFIQQLGRSYLDDDY